MNEHKTAIFCVTMLILLAGCSLLGTRNQNPLISDYEKFYVGTTGIQARFVNVPSRIYYYGPGDSAGNQFNFGVDVRNKGASFTRGGVYVSGFDPNLLVFREIPIAKGALGACGLSIGSIGFGELGGIFRCDGVQVSGGNGITNIRIDSMNKFITDLGGRFPQATWLDGSKFDFGVNYNSGPTGDFFILNVKDAAGNAEYYQHGRLFIAWLAGLDFIKNGGREFLLAGNTYDFPGGESTYFDYNGEIVDWPAGLDQTTQSLLLTTCYQYTTYADPIVCIDPQPMSDNRKVCYPKSKTWGGGNGAPVAITSVEQENTPRKIIFHINIKNIGTGTVYDPGKLEKCSPYSPDRATQADLNVVYLGDVRIGNVGLKTREGTGGMQCSPEVIRLDPTTRTGSTTCSYPIDAAYMNIKSAYQTPLVVELWYGYSEALQQNIVIKRVT